jgi:hypothetical protein
MHLPDQKPNIRVHLLRQGAHNAFKSHQGHSIRGEGPKKTRHKTPPIPFIPLLLIHSFGGIPPGGEPASLAQRIRHNLLLDDVARVRREPEDLGREATRPEIDGRGGKLSVFLEEGGEEVVAAPPEAEKGAEEEGGRETVVEAAEAV